MSICVEEVSEVERERADLYHVTGMHHFLGSTSDVGTKRNSCLNFLMIQYASRVSC